MKTIGLIGGMSWESTAVYYQYINDAVKERLGGLHSAKSIVWSFDFHDIETLQANGDWEAATQEMISAAQSLERAGAECLIICTNTMHKIAGEVQSACTIPLIHIADATAASIKKSPSTQPLLLGTRYTMEQDFYQGRLQTRHAIDVAIPDDAQREVIHTVIYDELCQGIISHESQEAYLDVIQANTAHGIDGVIFGCTEIGLLLKPEQLDLPVFDTTYIHALAAVDFALS